ncbi:hypothetical protein CDD83_6679 [Cordyceps sp. RAO-2017]|nr:hypothetical protein CDD83_6679 [Cordyceps sp. RAO-2017]
MITSLSALALLVAGAAAHGINCRGSGGCLSSDAKLSDLLVQLQQLQAQDHGRRHFRQNVQLACVQGKASSLCASYKDGPGGSADRAVELVKELMDHGCQQCGKNPTQPGRDSTDGHLLVDVSYTPCCHGNCRCPI